VVDVAVAAAAADAIAEASRENAAGR